MVLIVCGGLERGVRPLWVLLWSTASMSLFGGRAIVEDTLVDAADEGADEYGHGEFIDSPFPELSRLGGSSFTFSFCCLPPYPWIQTSPNNSPYGIDRPPPIATGALNAQLLTVPPFSPGPPVDNPLRGDSTSSVNTDCRVNPQLSWSRYMGGSSVDSEGLMTPATSHLTFSLSGQTISSLSSILYD